MRYYLPHPPRQEVIHNTVRSNFVSLAFSPPPAVLALLQVVWEEHFPSILSHNEAYALGSSSDEIHTDTCLARSVRSDLGS